jgi:hypothetical protein
MMQFCCSCQQSTVLQKALLWGLLWAAGAVCHQLVCLGAVFCWGRGVLCTIRVEIIQGRAAHFAQQHTSGPHEQLML